MQQAAIPGYRLSKSKHSTKVLTSLGLLGLFWGLLSAATLTLVKTGISPTDVCLYYRGSSATANESSLEATLAPFSPRPLAELAEVTHMHLIGGSLLLFLLCHLLSVCELQDKLRTILYCVSFGSFLLTFSLPWLIIYASPVFAWFFGPAMIIFLSTLFILTFIPLREMWAPPQ